MVKKLTLATSKHCFDYAAECGEQDLIDTIPFKSHLLVAFMVLSNKFSKPGEAGACV